tara:strand:- start:401 stop:1291 length:891 start_codon:yes stop_codon:yes gene_type:complete
MENFQNKKTVISFLGTGRLGLLVAESLLKNNYKVKIVKRKNSKTNLQSLIDLGATTFELDYENLEELNQFIDIGCNVYIGNIYQSKLLNKLIDNFQKIKNQINKFVFISGANSAAVSQAHSDLEKFEDTILEKLQNSIIIKSTMIFGVKNDLNIERITKLLIKYPFFPIVGNGQTLYQPIHYYDLSQTIVKAFNLENNTGKKIMVGGKDKIQYIDLIKLIKKKINSKSIIIKIPYKITYILLLIISKIMRKKFIIEKIRSINIDRDVINTEAEKILDHHPISLEYRLAEAIKEYLK